MKVIVVRMIDLTSNDTILLTLVLSGRTLERILATEHQRHEAYTKAS